MSDCIFCRIVRDQAPARIVYQDEDVTAFHDLNPCAPTHVLIIPNRHVAGADQIGQADTVLMGKLFVVARHLAEQEGVADGYRLVINNGPLAGQSVFHLHIHLLGGRPLSWPPG